MHEILIEEKVFARNDAIAKENREYFKKRGIFVMNLVSSPGSGKTSLIEKTLEQGCKFTQSGCHSGRYSDRQRCSKDS